MTTLTETLEELRRVLSLSGEEFMQQQARESYHRAWHRLTDIYRERLAAAGLRDADVEPVRTVDEMVAEMRGRGWGVSCWSTARDTWVVSVEPQPREHGSEQFEGATLHEAASKALAWRLLPRVPRPPQLISSAKFAIEKSNDGRRWEICERSESGRSGWHVATLATRKQCMEAVQTMVRRSQRHYDSWLSFYGWTLNAREGVDFRWSSFTFDPSQPRPSTLTPPADPV